MPNLSRVELSFTRITDDALAELAHVDGLRYIDVSGTRITDVGASYLSSCRGLESILIDGTRISDSGLRMLGRCPSVRFISARHSRVTAAGIDGLRPVTELLTIRVDQEIIAKHKANGAVVTPARVIVRSD